MNGQKSVRTQVFTAFWKTCLSKPAPDTPVPERTKRLPNHRTGLIPFLWNPPRTYDNATVDSLVCVMPGSPVGPCCIVN